MPTQLLPNTHILHTTNTPTWKVSQHIIIPTVNNTSYTELKNREIGAFYVQNPFILEILRLSIP